VTGKLSLMDPAARPALPEVPLAERIAHARPVIAVVEVGEPWIADGIERALAARGARVTRLRALLRHAPGHEQVGTELRAHPDALLKGTRALLAELPPHDVVLAIGAPLFVSLAPQLALLGAPSSALVALPAELRPLRDAFDLVLHAPREGVLGHLAATVFPNV
jgi:hypothetical protein